MSQSIWTQCAGPSELRRIALTPYRVVESQYVNSTRKLVDSDDEQAVLEALIERAKPPIPTGPRFRGLHYLLYTSFRHPPLRYGSRFGIKAERGIWYGALEMRTALAEVAYYRLVFLEGTAAQIEPITVELSSFRASVATSRGIDLTRAPFSAHERVISSKTSYQAAQALGADMRAAGVDAFVYRSARDRENGKCLGLFEPCFSKKKPTVPDARLRRAASR
jgi:hypothetical protein